jgi:hypothetical protein
MYHHTVHKVSEWINCKHFKFWDSTMLTHQHWDTWTNLNDLRTEMLNQLYQAKFFLMTVAHVVNTFPAFYGSQSSLTCAQRVHHWTLSWVRWTQSILSTSLRTTFTVISSLNHIPFKCCKQEDMMYIILIIYSHGVVASKQ